MRATDTVPSVLDTLVSGGSEAGLVARQLVKLAQSGLLPSELSLLLDSVFANTLSTSQRNKVVAALVPRGDYYIPDETLSRVLGTVGAPEVFYKAGKQHKLKRLAVSTQQKLLEWLVAVAPHFDDVFRLLRRFLPMLFGLLSYEYLRPQITTLIVLALGKAGTKSVRQWHVQLVADLALRFPFDGYLQGLLRYFRTYFPATRVYLAGVAAAPGKSFVAPSDKFLRPQSLDSDVARRIRQNESSLSAIIKDFAAMSTPSKRKFDAMETPPTINSAAKLGSVAEIVENFEKIQLVNPSSVLSVTSTPFAPLYLTMKLFTCTPSDATSKKLAYAIKYHILAKDNHSALLVFPQLVNFARHGGLQHLLLDTVFDFLADELPPSNKQSALLASHQIELCVHLPTGDSRTSTALHQVLLNIAKLKSEDSNNLIGAYYASVSFIVRKDSTSFDTAILKHIFDHTSRIWTHLRLEAKLQFLTLLSSLKYLKEAKLSEDMMLPPTLIYQLVVSTNPLVVSEVLGYIAFLKTIKIGEDQTKSLELRNAYVMDSINFAWRDMAFKKEQDTFNKGMFLATEYLEHVGGLNFFNNSDLIQLKSVGGLIHNPSFSYLCAELLWRLEDGSEGLTTRHHGPLSENSVAQLHQDSEVTWLPLSYYDIKVSLLNSLDELGFTGLCDLLFTSLKTLTEKRTRTLYNM